MDYVKLISAYNYICDPLMKLIDLINLIYHYYLMGELASTGETEILYPGQVHSSSDTDIVYVQLTHHKNMCFKFYKSKLRRFFPSSLLARAIELDPEVKVIPINNHVVIPEA